MRTFADLREVTGSGEMELSLPEGESMRGLLEGVCKTYPPLRVKIFDEAGNLKPYVLVLRNGRNIDSLQRLDTLLADRDIVSLFPPVAGG